MQTGVHARVSRALVPASRMWHAPPQIGQQRRIGGVHSTGRQDAACWHCSTPPCRALRLRLLCPLLKRRVRSRRVYVVHRQVHGFDAGVPPMAWPRLASRLAGRPEP